jgi:hypothetical protein
LYDLEVEWGVVAVAEANEIANVADCEIPILEQ